MSELQIGLLVLGAAIITLVFGFNVFQEWRFRRKTRQAFARQHSDVLLDVPKNHVRDGVKADRLEPVFPGAAPAAERVEPASLNNKPSQPADAAAPAIAEPQRTEEIPPVHAEPMMDVNELKLVDLAWLDDSLDFIADIALTAPHALTSVPRFNTTRRVQMIGCTEQGRWQPVEALPGVRYVAFRIGLQLVDRSGVLSEADLGQFCQQVTQFADAHDAAVSFPHRHEQLTAARELDQFCAEVDVMIGINIAPSAPIDGSRLRVVVEAAGFMLEPDGAFHYLSEHGNTLYTLTAADQTPFTPHTLLDKPFAALTLVYDVPRVEGGVVSFDQALAFARSLAHEFGGQLVDDNSRPLTDAGLARIRQQLAQIYERMQERELEPGGDAALRLFA
ncbi:cell division protein ZipA C-terminal FtsZ-binding domain-containing protein [Crenobacter sp. SG2303]|uniref:Cell division protein ZipA n=1 Tax=Crenobacter oryzisoli TaxID=3056844 RepID=A0ABT7XQH7_9NEIS|nr:cell division protein ZipA C-terminal FtsZ-binding domain-containing protein [Crenobacter sp. SG2303]MDN0075819.1 cell division protein ZipA C-terminal FtsZ-binding domain-containing protein [Crenobacter sp. SG2303]